MQRTQILQIVQIKMATRISQIATMSIKKVMKRGPRFRGSFFLVLIDTNLSYT